MMHEKKSREIVIVFFLFVVAALTWWGSVLPNFASHVIGWGSDPFQTLWRFVRLGEVLREGSLTIPEEAMLRNFGPLPWLPLSLLLGEIPAANIAWFGSAVLSGWCMYLLARAWGGRTMPAVVVGLLVMFSPYRLSHALGHFGAMQLWWIPATLLAFTLWYRRPTWTRSVLVAVLLVGTAWTEHTLFVMLVVFLLIGAAMIPGTAIRLLRASRSQSFVILGIFFLGAVLPFTSELFLASDTEGFFNRGADQRTRFSATPSSLVLPASFSFFRDGIRGYGDETMSVSDHTFTFGFLLPLAILGAATRRRWSRRERMLAVVAGVGILFALGPRVTIGSIDIPMPVALFDTLPVLSAIRTVGRFLALTVVALPLLFALRWSRTYFSAPLTALVGLLLVLEILPAPGFPVMAAHNEKVERALQTLPKGAVVILPSYTNPRVASEHLYWSLFSDHSLIGNSALERSQSPASRKAFLATPLLRDLALLRTEDLVHPTLFGQELSDVAPLLFSVHAVRGIVFHTKPSGGVVSFAERTPRLLSDEEVSRVRTFLRDTLTLSEEQIDENVFLYRIPDDRIGDAAVSYPLDGWVVVERTSTTRIFQIAPTARMNVILHPSRREHVAWEATVNDPGVARTLSFAGDRGQVSVPIVKNGVLRVSLENVLSKTGVIELTVDGEGLVIEQPRLVFSSKTL